MTGTNINIFQEYITEISKYITGIFAAVEK